MRRPSVALLIETSNAYARGILQGIIDYQRKHDSWSIYLPEQERGAAAPEWLKRWNGDGVIARIESEGIAKAVRSIGVPVVDVSAARRIPGIPWVETDDAMVSGLAAEHLLERGFRQFAFCGDSSFNWSRWRWEHFRAHLEKSGYQAIEYPSSGSHSAGYSWPKEKRRLSQWLKQLPKPIGLMASYDIQAQQVLDICRELEIKVPDEVAVVGVDNDPIVCNLAHPSLTSVIPDAARAGYVASELLEKMMKGEHVPTDARLLPPLGLATRQSTDVWAVEDIDIANAAKYIRDHAFEGITVADLLREIPLSRRVLEKKFREATGKTPHDAIVTQRLSKVEQLLRETDLSLEAIAAKVGFEHAEYLNVAFRKHYHDPPGKYRRKHRSME